MNSRKSAAIIIFGLWSVAMACSPIAKILSTKAADVASMTPTELTIIPTEISTLTPTSAPIWPTSTTDPFLASFRSLKATEIWGQAGSEPGSLQNPRGIAVAPDGSVYVVETGNNRVQHFDPAGKLLHSWGTFSGTDALKAPNGEFNEPWGIAVGSDGSVYVADTWNHRIQKFSATGTFLKTWGLYQASDPEYQLFGPRAVAVDSQGRVFVADTGDKRIMIYASDGKYLNQIGAEGSGDGQLDEPVGLAFGLDGSLYVADAWNLRIQIFRELGGDWLYQTQWPIAVWEDTGIYNKPFLAVSGDGRVWATDPANSRVLVFNAEGKLLFDFGTSGNDGYSFAFPTGIAADAKGRIVIADSDNNRIMIFAGL